MSSPQYDWTAESVLAILDLPFGDLLFEAARIHREHFDPQEIEGAILLSVKTGACPEDCNYCAQSVKWSTDLDVERLMPVEEIIQAARAAQASGATRFCMGAAWRSPNDRQVDHLAAAVTQVRDLGLETCLTLGMLSTEQAERLKGAGLDYYNHNLDTSPEFYEEIITTRTYEDRLDTLRSVREAGINVCSGGIVGLGESRSVRAGLLAQLASLRPHPESVPVNLLVKIPGTPLFGTPSLDPFELVRTIATARITMPKSMVRLAAGRNEMSDELQALCFQAGANSVFLGDRLLTTDNAGQDRDASLFERLNLRVSVPSNQPAQPVRLELVAESAPN